MWAEIYIRSPTGDLSWIMRIQNDDQDLTASTFPDLPLANISSLLRGTIDHTDEFDQLLGEDRKIDSSSLPENEYESLLEEHFNLPSTGGFSSVHLEVPLIFSLILFQNNFTKMSNPKPETVSLQYLYFCCLVCFGLTKSRAMSWHSYIAK